MEDINSVIIVGRLVKDAELAYTTSGFPLLKFVIATNRRKKIDGEWGDEGQFFDAVLWGKQGESVAPYMTKGAQVGVSGELDQQRWESQDGSKRSKVVIEAKHVQLLGGKRGTVGDTVQAAVSDRTPVQRVADVFRDDVPF